MFDTVENVDKSKLIACSPSAPWYLVVRDTALMRLDGDEMDKMDGRLPRDHVSETFMKFFSVKAGRVLLYFNWPNDDLLPLNATAETVAAYYARHMNSNTLPASPYDHKRREIHLPEVV